MRVGLGFDAHQLKMGRKLILAGVEVPYQFGLDGHSDGDVAIHAVIDAVLGAARQGDIGQHFPSTDGRYRGVSSRVLLRETARIVSEAGYQVGNVDVVIVAQRPRLTYYRPQMEACLAEDLGLELDDVSVKATTTDRMGFAGEGLGIAAYAVALVSRSS